MFITFQLRCLFACISVNRYEVEVYTATRNPPEALDYHIALFGERGDTGRRTFLKPLSSAAVGLKSSRKIVPSFNMWSFGCDIKCLRKPCGKEAPSESERI